MDIALWNTLIAVGSALLGVVIGGVLTIWNDTLKWRREQQVRYNADRLKAYTDFLQTVDHAAFTWGPFWIKGGQVYAGMLPPNSWRILRQQTMPTKRSLSWGPKGVQAAASDVYDSLSAIVMEGRNALPHLRTAQAAFREKAQQELGVKAKG